MNLTSYEGVEMDLESKIDGKGNSRALPDLDKTNKEKIATTLQILNKY